MARNNRGYVCVAAGDKLVRGVLPHRFSPSFSKHSRRTHDESLNTGKYKYFNTSRLLVCIQRTCIPSIRWSTVASHVSDPSSMLPVIHARISSHSFVFTRTRERGQSGVDQAPRAPTVVMRRNRRLFTRGYWTHVRPHIRDCRFIPGAAR